MLSGRGSDGAEQGSSPAQSQDGGSRTLPCLIQDSELVLAEKLGSGSFGVVKKGEWHTPTGRVVRDSFIKAAGLCIDDNSVVYIWRIRHL